MAGLAALPSIAAAHASVDELEREAAALTERRPADPDAHLQRARTLRLAGRWDAALAELETAAAWGADPDEVGATRGLVLLDAGRPRDALDELDRVLARRPDAHALLFERGRALLALGDRERAARELGRAIAGMAAPRPEHVMARRDVLVSLGRRAEAIAALDEGMRRVGRVASLQLAAIDLEVEIGRHDDALGRLDELLAKEGPNPAWMARRGEILARAGKGAEARADYQRALSLIASHSTSRRAGGFEQLERRLRSLLASMPEGGQCQ
jgi:tetratricopeptide (TPR) repeat protein